MIFNWWLSKYGFTFEIIDKVRIDNLTNVFSSCIVSDKKEKRV